MGAPADDAPALRRPRDPRRTECTSYRIHLGTLVAEEIAHRTETRLARAVRKARFPFLRTIDEFNFTFHVALKLQMLGSYLGSELVTDGRGDSIWRKKSDRVRIQGSSRNRVGDFVIMLDS